MDPLVRLWNRVVVRALFELAEALLGRWTVPLSEWLVTRAGRRLSPRTRAECERQWLADLYGLPAWLQLRSAVSLVLSGDIASIPEPKANTLSKAVASPSNVITLEALRRPLIPDSPSAPYDLLTGLLNRRALTRRLTRSLSGFRPHAHQLAVLLVDVDNFKSINRELGRLAGDALLRELTRRLRGGLHGRGLIGRFGGNQFAVLLPNTPPSMVLEIAERLRCACEFPLRAVGSTFRVSASLGIASVAPGLKADELWGRANLALGEAKQDGRNCVRRFEQTTT